MPGFESSTSQTCSESFNVFRPMLIFSGRDPRAGLETLEGRIQPTGRSLETLVLGAVRESG